MVSRPEVLTRLAKTSHLFVVVLSFLLRGLAPSVPQFLLSPCFSWILKITATMSKGFPGAQMELDATQNVH